MMTMMSVMSVVMSPASVSSMTMFISMSESGIMSVIISGFMSVVGVPFIPGRVGFVASVVDASPVGFIALGEAVLSLVIVAVVSFPSMGVVVVVMPVGAVSVMLSVMVVVVVGFPAVMTVVAVEEA
uniref:Secreted peptide n=1 Tax=Bursaphelenchus xylophilus TaxID=6326 RepID=A0A1I7SEL7_BURXY